ncbi:hypothetical protein NGC66_08785 [Staphylococcus xylosus]|uniref:type I restriction-modification enzyme R subunit C-terminal domain-containing protein n=1 Tax=Staphylococcus xylosus TaxID=1288 RepID=UPI002DBD3800|nr:type I restriction-modification enzyme R subunit C-terminal domain-containing protein [Staphylococcus xylosus]MEB7858175.1 hypothetical protein [Staphylococcus xylosus]
MIDIYKEKFVYYERLLSLQFYSSEHIYHNPTKGEEREKFITFLISSLLPQINYSRGILTESTWQSKQVDFVKLNSNTINTGTIFRTCDALIFMEIKSNAKTKEFVELNEIAEVLKQYNDKILVGLGSIPQIREHADIIKDVQNDSFWLQSSIERLEEVRYSLRGLIKFIEKNKRKIYYTNFEDEVIEQESGEPIYDVNDLHSYKEKVNHYIKENKDHVAVYKLYHNKPLTKNDVEALEEVLWKELGTKEQYEKNYSNKSVTVLVREIVGLDKQAVNEVFSEFLTEGRLNSNQIDFLKRIIDYISQNGILEKKELLRDPFRQLGTISKLFEDNQDDAKKIIEIIDYINENGTVS